MFVDDDQNVLRAVERTLRHTPYRVLLANSPHEALRILGTQTVDIVISDERMPKMTGIELLGKVRQRFPSAVRILFTAHVDQKTLLRAINEGEVFRFIPKPYHPPDLLDVLKAASAKVGPTTPGAKNNPGSTLRPVTTAGSLQESTTTLATGAVPNDKSEWEDVEPDATAALQSEPSNEEKIDISEADFSAAWEQHILGRRPTSRERTAHRRERQPAARARSRRTGGSGPPNG
jgi:CheY-like chemotaxis protein